MTICSLPVIMTGSLVRSDMEVAPKALIPRVLPNVAQLTDAMT